ncbi:protein of unknown function DUF497 [Gloeocapsa sp. PCC 7428]|nr:protein of unknown function DUF497 [Gloeocapsa sp. PCC 7428]
MQEIYYDEAHSDQEDRFKIIGMSSNGRLLVAAYSQRVDIGKMYFFLRQLKPHQGLRNVMLLTTHHDFLCNGVEPS